MYKVIRLAHTNSAEREQFFGQHDQVRIYGADYVDRLTRAGLVVEVIDYTGGMNVGMLERYGLDKGEKIYLCGKLNAKSGQV